MRTGTLAEALAIARGEEVVLPAFVGEFLDTDGFCPRCGYAQDLHGDMALVGCPDEATAREAWGDR